jgi:hypothetical protein
MVPMDNPQLRHPAFLGCRDGAESIEALGGALPFSRAAIKVAQNSRSENFKYAWKKSWLN